MSDGGRQTWTDTEVERLIAQLLKAGVVAAAATVLLGGVLAIARTGGRPRPDLSRFDAASSALLPHGDLVRGLWHLDSTAWIQVGLVILVATPVLRVAVSAYAFVRQRDWTYVVITLAVLAVLTYGLLGGIG